MLRPTRHRLQSNGGLAGLTDFSETIVRGILHILAYAVRSVSRLQTKLARRAGPRAEYRADEAAARMASTDAVAALLDKLLLAQMSRAFVATSIRGRDAEMWSTVRSKLIAVPARERERLRRVARLKHQAVDASHPPTSQRIDLLSTRLIAAPEVPPEPGCRVCD